MTARSVTERDVIQWFLEAVNQRGDRDAARQNLDKVLAARVDPDLLHAFAVQVAPMLATATGALTFRAVLTPISWGRMQVSPVIDGWNPATASKGTEAFALSLLLDETRVHRDYLGKCGVCGRYFLAAEKEGPGLKATAYCSDEHRDEAKRLKMLERVRKHRARKLTPVRRKP
jgi:hypothetical protein